MDSEQLTLVPPKPSAQMPGAGQRARQEARERQGAVGHTYRRIEQAIEAHGPLTRKEIAAALAMNVNTVNARVSEMRLFDADTPWRIVTHGRRNGEGICHLYRLRTWED